MKIVTSQQMRELDRLAIQKHSIPSLTLMERAGAAVARAVLSRCAAGEGRVAVVAGKGNNGGDALVAARHLLQAGAEVHVLLLAQTNDLSPDARANFELLAPLTAHILFAATPAEFAAIAPTLAQASAIVDGIFGTGLEREVTGAAAAAIAAINAAGVPAIAVDVPSGLSADTGRVMGEAVRACTTVTLGLPKRGLVIGAGPDLAGEIEIADIGIPPEEIAAVSTDLELIEPSMFGRHFGRRDPSSHKGTYGHVAVFAGSRGHLGAGYLSCLAALRAGAGLATYCLPEKAFVRFDARYAEVMCDPIPDEGTAHFHPSGLDAALASAAKKSAVAVGPAIGTEKQTAAFVNAFVQKVRLPLIIDADGLNVLDLASLKGRTAPTILTPHPGEMARLCAASASAIQADRIGAAARLAAGAGAAVVLKGRGTIVASPGGAAAINTTGNAGMATAGMGDALTGVIAAFLAEGMDAKTACCAAVHLHGLAGDMAACEHGERSLITSDVIRCLGKAMMKIFPSP